MQRVRDDHFLIPTHRGNVPSNRKLGWESLPEKASEDTPTPPSDKALSNTIFPRIREELDLKPPHDLKKHSHTFKCFARSSRYGMSKF